jgi:hypothetical protein
MHSAQAQMLYTQKAAGSSPASPTTAPSRFASRTPVALPRFTIARLHYLTNIPELVYLPDENSRKPCPCSLDFPPADLGTRRR